MKLLLDIPENKAQFVLELLQKHAFIKATTVNEDFTSNLSQQEKEAIDASLKSIENENVLDHDEVMSILQERHPKYFTKK